MTVPLGSIFVDAVVGAGDKKISRGTEGQVIGGDAGFESGEDEDLLVAGDFEDGAVAVADVETLFAIEGDAGGHAHAFGVGGHGSVGRDAVDGAIEARRNIHLALAIEGDGGGIHHLGDEGLDVVVGVDLEDGDRNFLAARTGESDVDIAFGVEGGVGHGVQIFGDGDSDLHRVGIADVAVGSDDDRA